MISDSKHPSPKAYGTLSLSSSSTSTSTSTSVFASTAGPLSLVRSPASLLWFGFWSSNEWKNSKFNIFCVDDNSFPPLIWIWDQKPKQSRESGEQTSDEGPAVEAKTEVEVEGEGEVEVEGEVEGEVEVEEEDNESVPYAFGEGCFESDIIVSTLSSKALEHVQYH